MTSQEPTTKEIMKVVIGVKENTEQILEAIGIFSNNTEKKFEALNTKISGIKANMVTKDYLDEKVLALKGDLIVLTRKEDRKLAELVKILEERKVLTTEDAKRVLAMEPFPQS